MSSLSQIVKDFFDQATPDEVRALWEASGAAIYEGELTVQEYLDAIEPHVLSAAINLVDADYSKNAARVALVHGCSEMDYRGDLGDINSLSILLRHAVLMSNYEDAETISDFDDKQLDHQNGNYGNVIASQKDFAWNPVLDLATNDYTYDMAA